MALTTVVAGPYTSTWSGTDTGDTEDGFHLRFTISKQVITGDAYGDSAIDGVYRGGNYFLSFVLIEYSDAIALFSPYGAFGLLGALGRLDSGSSLAKPVVLTAIAGSTAATAPATLTAAESILSSTAQVDVHFSSRARFVPIELRLYANSSPVQWFATTP